MELEHGIEIPSYKEIWEAIEETYNYETEKQEKKNTIMKVKREIFLKRWKPILDEVQRRTEEKFKSLYYRCP